MLLRSSLVLALLGTSAAACPWSDGTYSGRYREIGLSIDFTVNSDCTEVTFRSSGSTGFQPVNTPQDFPMKARYDYWEADINGARATFNADRSWVEFFVNGNNRRVRVTRQD